LILLKYVTKIGSFVLRLTAALTLEFDDDQVSGGNRSLTVGSSRSAMTAFS
jgi:hypothetical protein